VITTRTIQKEDLERAAQINDAVALEHGLTDEGAHIIGEQLGVDILGAAIMAWEHALRRHPKRPSRAEAREATTHAFTMGVLSALRAVEVVGRWE
jgi:hypothetical protein